MCKQVLRIISGVMLVIAVAFLACALTHPEFGTVFYIGGLKIGATAWRACYIVYALVMIGLFAASFLIGKAKTEKSK